MRRGDVTLAAQIIANMKVAADKIEKYTKSKDSDSAAIAKKEIINLQRQLESIL